MQTKSTRVYRGEAFWLEHVIACVRAGGGVRAYTQAHGLSEKSFYYWRQTLSKRGKLPDDLASPMFCRLTVTPDTSMSPQDDPLPVPHAASIGPGALTMVEGISGCHIRLSNGSTVELTGRLSMSLIGHVLQVAGSLPMVSGRIVR
ncbi:MAG: hypothetical protein HQM03_18320 [Magnetococcales bacterium]|nr:hypothetical protein [Magnetococcales bacterium]